MSGLPHRFLNIDHKKTPLFIRVNVNWFSRPGIASTFIPIDGIVHAWITSEEVTSNRISVGIGKIIRLSTSSSRYSPFDNKSVCFIKESNLMVGKSLYSYLQYHWWPTDFIVSLGLIDSSMVYNKFSDGTANISREITSLDSKLPDQTEVHIRTVLSSDPLAERNSPHSSRTLFAQWRRWRCCWKTFEYDKFPEKQAQFS